MECRNLIEALLLEDYSSAKVTSVRTGNKAIRSLLSFFPYVLSHAYYTFSLSVLKKAERRSEK